MACTRLEWNREIRGADALVTARVSTPAGLSDFPAVQRAYQLAASMVPLRPARYRHQSAFGRAREAADRAAAERACVAACELWAVLVLDAVEAELRAELWEITEYWSQPRAPHLCRSLAAYRAKEGPVCVSQPDLPSAGARVVARPITAAAHAIAEAETAGLRSRAVAAAAH